MSIQKRPDRPKKWKVRVRTPEGRQVTRSFDRRIDAERWEAAQKVDMARGEWVDPRAGDLRLSDWLDEVDAAKINLGEETRKTRRSLIDNHLKPGLGRWPIGKLTAEEIQRFVSEKKTTLAPATVEKIAVILSEALRLAVARGRLVRSPYVEIELPAAVKPAQRYLTEAEVWQLTEALSVRSRNRGATEGIGRYRIFALLGAYAGLRPGESLELQWSDLDLDRRSMLVRGTKTPGSRRTIRIPPLLVQALREHREAYPHLTQVVHNTAGRPPSLDGLRARQWKDAVAASVGEPMTPHDLRHTHVGLLIAQGAHSKAIMDRLGHTSIRTTIDIYGHLIEGVEADVVDRLGGDWDGSDGTQVVPNEKDPPSEESGSGL